MGLWPSNEDLLNYAKRNHEDRRQQITEAVEKKLISAEDAVIALQVEDVIYYAGVKEFHEQTAAIAAENAGKE